MSLCVTGTDVFPVDETFKLYNTCGFPFTDVMALEHGLAVDAERFKKLLREQREHADYAAKKSVVMARPKRFLNEPYFVQSDRNHY